MRLRILTFIAIALIALLPSLPAQAETNIYLGLGAAQPVGDLESAVDLGFDFMFGIGFMATEKLEIIPQFGYTVFSQTYEDSPLGVVTPGINVAYHPGSAESRTHPYLLGSVGAAFLFGYDNLIDRQRLLFEWDLGPDEVAPFLALGGGIVHRKLFVEARWERVFSDPFAFSFIAVRGGVRL